MLSKLIGTIAILAMFLTACSSNSNQKITEQEKLEMKQLDSLVNKIVDHKKSQKKEKLPAQK